MKPSRETIERIEEVAANAVAPQTVQLVDGWLLRASPEAPFRRSNSVLPMRGIEDGGLDERLALVEEFYRRRALPVRYQLGPLVVPADLEQHLTARGYQIEISSLVQIAGTSAVVAATASSAAAATVRITDQVDASWMVACADAHGADDARARVAAYGRVLDRLGPRHAGLVALLPDGGVAAAAFVVIERGWAGIFGMGTHPAARRRGLATAMLHALARHAREAGATQLYLQVEADNAPALALYARAGFGPLYGYHYRTLGLHTHG